MAIQPINTPVGVNYAHITGAGTVVVKANPGILDGMVINKNTGTVSTITFYDSPTAAGIGAGVEIAATGTVSATITGTTPVGVTYGLNYNTGLTIVTAGSADITVMYK